MFKKIVRYILEKTPVSHLVQLSKSIVLPGFDGIPLYDVARFFLRGLQKGAINTRASSLAFRFFLALFPGIIFLFTLIPYIPIDNFHEELLLQLQTILPEEAFNLSKATIDDLLNQERTGLLSFGFILTIYFATNGISAMIAAFDQSYLTTESRSILMQRLISVLLIFILFLLVVTSVVLIVFSEIIIDALVDYNVLSGGWDLIMLQLGKWLVILSLIYFSVSFIYFMAPSRNLTKWKFFSAGSSLATVMIIIVSVGFSFYVNQFGQFNKLYGSIGSLLVLMLWMNFNCIILLIGFELNASIMNAGKDSLRLSESQNL